jgi:hypothetical protein
VIEHDISRIPERQQRELIRGENARAEFAIYAQRRLQEALQAMGPTRFIDGIGRKVATIHPELAARLRVKFGKHCLADMKFVHALIKENPFLKAPCVPRALTLRVNGLRDRQTGPGASNAHGAQPDVRAPGLGDPATPSLAGPEKPRLLSRTSSGHETGVAGARSRLSSKRLEIATR